MAHVDVPVESGPTRLLPFSQTFSAGHMAPDLEQGIILEAFVKGKSKIEALADLETFRKKIKA